MSQENAIVLRKMARYIRKHGFSPMIGDHGGPRCFLGAWGSAGGRLSMDDPFADAGALNSVLCIPTDTRTLRDCGWTKRDAAAACEIAADLETP